MTDLEQQVTEHLRRRAAAATPRYDLEGVERATSRASLVDLDDHRPRRLTTRAIAGLVAVAAAAAIAVVTIPSNESTSVLATGGGPEFAAAVEASGLLTPPSTDTAEQARDDSLYRPTGQAEVSAAGHRVSLRSCQPWASSTCGTGFAYVTRSADPDDAHGGLLGEASDLELQLLDDRYFVASETFVQTSRGVVDAPSRAWLIDAVSGGAGSLSWSDEPTTITSPAQALLWWEDTPHVLDAREGTIRPLAVPDDVLTPSFLPQYGTDRIWLRTDPAGDGLGLASSDDGGATWSDVALPGPLRLETEDAGFAAAAAGDRVAVESERMVYVSADSGRSWTSVTPPSDPEGLSNVAILDVLADGRLELRLMMDNHPQERFVSTGSDWAELEKVWDDSP
jgi:hypothetical protein